MKKFHITESVRVLDIQTANTILAEAGFIPQDIKQRGIQSQFRSYDFLPYISAFLAKYKDIPSERSGIEEISDIFSAVWRIYNFRNYKTPHKEPALIAESSGLGEKRFIEPVIQEENASTYFALSTGDRVYRIARFRKFKLDYVLYLNYYETSLFQGIKIFRTLKNRRRTETRYKINRLYQKKHSKNHNFF